MGPTMYAHGGAYVPLVTGQWVPVYFVVDLDNDRQRMYYNDSLL